MTADQYEHACAIARRACHGWTLSREDWEDVAQEAALRAWRTPDHFGSAAWWGAREAAERILRTRRKQPLRFVPLELEKPSGVDVEGEAVGAVMVDWALGHLPATQQVAIRLVDVDDRPWVEVERTLGRSDGSIAGRRRRGLERLRGVA
jgi:DNA-directed RNA polymerase specialized sigma24 family protein